MYYGNRLATPPSMNVQKFYSDNGESQYAGFQYMQSMDHSPDDILSHITTPPKSPEFNYRPQGPALLPKIRQQDQVVEPSAGPARNVRASSAHASSSLRTYALQHSVLNRRAQSPPEAYETSAYISDYNYPSSSASYAPTTLTSSATSTAPVNMTAGPMPSPCDSAFGGSALNSPVMATNPTPSQSVNHSRRSSLAHVRAVSTPAVPTVRSHMRSGSTSSIDEAAIWRHGYPTQYRQIPQYVTSAQTQTQVAAVAPMPTLQSAYTPSSQMMYPMEQPSTTSFTQNFSSSAPQETTSLLSYLTSPNPSCSQTIRRVIGEKRTKDWFWYDVRTLRNWSSFNIDTIMGIAQFPALLHIPMDASTLPHPAAPMHPPPETEYNLRVIYQDYFSVKVNAALKVTQGSQRHMFMEAINSATAGATPKPDFISNYADDVAFRTLNGDRRGRLVGVVKAYEQWNTGMRNQGPAQQVKYLAGLAHLHRIMREHGCRYGFIITEIELLCVRAGAKDDEHSKTPTKTSPIGKKKNAAESHSLDEGPMPIFGQLETAPPIPLSTSGVDRTTQGPQMTAALALWYLHMLAKEDPLPGMPVWNMAVSGVAAHTRKNCGERDPWMPKVGQHEAREARRMRGWVWPEEPVNRKEYPNKKRRGQLSAR